MAAHWQLAVAGHAVGGIGELDRDASVRARELAIGVVLALGVLVGEIQRLHVDLEHACRRCDELAEAGRECRVLGDSLAELQARRVRKKRERRELQIEFALREWDAWLEKNQHRRHVGQVSAS